MTKLFMEHIIISKLFYYRYPSAEAVPAVRRNAKGSCRSMGLKVVKFGGSSLADAEHFRRVAAIVKADPDRRFVVASAPGKRFSKDIKVTDMLYR